ncbi:MAG: phosphoglycerate dehydrogenase [Burkholderiales bacterium]|nr:phosphoglycerate dehydrogenase [Burkholderiales bacterium]MDQ3194954.1 phosphoglycerate dehydrogenase [Pseudomonadota bacterium]
MPKPFRILTLNQISPIGIAQFPGNRYVVGKDLSDPDAIVLRSHNLYDMTIPASVRVVGRAGAGTNNIPVARLSTRGIPVFNTPGANANAVKELVIAGLLLSARNLIPAARYVEALQSDGDALEAQVEAGKKQFAGSELPGRTLGVIGLGKIGSLVADAAIKLGMKVLGFDPGITVDAAWSLPSQVQKARSIEELLKNSDFVTVHVPLIDMTRHMIDLKRVMAMKNGAVLLNFSRDAIVDTGAVLEALNSGRIKYYVCDFPDARLRGHANVVALPHLGASTTEAEDNCAVMAANQVRDYLEHGQIVNAVNFPDVDMARESPYRIGVANANVPNMVGQISTAVAAAGLNIHNMLNKSKGEMAYTLVDLDSPVTPDLCKQIAAIPGVLMIRYLPADLS